MDMFCPGLFHYTLQQSCRRKRGIWAIKLGVALQEFLVLPGMAIEFLIR